MQIEKVNSLITTLVLLSNSLNAVKCFSSNDNTIRQRFPLQVLKSHHQNSYDKPTTSTSRRSQNTSNNEYGIDRRKAFTSLTALFTILSSSIKTSSPANAADDRLFKQNPLTNPVLEKIRIWEQAEADDIKYGGELAAPGSPKGQEAYAKLLVPILRIQMSLTAVDDLVHMENGNGLDEAMKILNQQYFEKIQFKKIFNAFADNIYYSDPDRANAYLGGGAIPKNEQSIAYLIRNDILTNIENLQAEVAYLIKEKKAGNPLEVDDLFLYSQTCKDDMVKYLDLVPPRELKLANDILSN